MSLDDLFKDLENEIKEKKGINEVKEKPKQEKIEEEIAEEVYSKLEKESEKENKKCNTIDDFFSEMETIKKPEPKEIKEENKKDDFISEKIEYKSKDISKPEIKKEEVKPEPITRDIISVSDDEFDFTEEIDIGKEIHIIYGHKGHGKTAFSMSYPGKVAVLSFDKKSTAIKHLYPNRINEIKVWDIVKYMDYTVPENELSSANKTYKYLITLLDKVIRKWEPDWVVIDGSEILSQICELKMRYNNGLMPYQGITNRNLWKERKMYLRQAHHNALDIAKKGIIYTAYVDKEEIIEDGEIKTKKDCPKWLDILVYETDVVIRTFAKFEKGSGIKFFAIVESSKLPHIKTGIIVDYTNKSGYEEIIKKSKEVL